MKNKFPLRFSVIFTFVFVVLYWPGAVGVHVNGVFEHLEDVFHDKLFLLREPKLKAGDPRIILAAVDEDTVRKHGFPLPRLYYAKLLDKLAEYGAKTVAVDVIFPEPREHDGELVAATRRFKRVIHLFTTATQDTPHGQVVNVNLPISGLVKASQYLGYPNIDMVIDDDGHVRRSMMFDKRTNDPLHSDRMAPSMDVVSVASYLDKPVEKLYEELGDSILLINFRRPVQWLQHQARDGSKEGQIANLSKIDSPYQTISVMDLLSGELTPAQRKTLKGSLIIVGSTTLGYFDHYPTPFTPQSPGAEYHANNVDNLLNGDFLRATPRGWILLAILFMIWLPQVLLRFPPTAGNAAAAGVLAGWFAYVYWSFAQGRRVDFVAPAFALVVSFLVLTVHRVLTEGAEKKFIKALFGQFVAPEVVEDIVKDPGKVKLGGEKRDMTIFFLDIAHFTTISEKMAPEALIVFLNRYLSALSKIVHDHKGVVDKYIGDCIMAFWNAPIEMKDHRLQACLAAVECQEMMAELNKNLDPGLPETPQVRIGLNSGQATVGLTGSEKKLQYTVIGDEVNLASRLEGANKFFGSRIMVSESTLDGARDFLEVRELGRVRVVGKALPIKVFELLASKGKLSPQWKEALPLYEQGVEHFNKRRFAEASACFEKILKIVPHDGPSQLYLTVSTDYGAIPPPEDWDGVFNLTAK